MKIRQRALCASAVCFVAFVAALMGCGGSNDDNSGGSATPPDALVSEFTSTTSVSELSNTASKAFFSIGAGSSTVPSMFNGFPTDASIVSAVGEVQAAANSGDARAFKTVSEFHAALPWLTITDTKLLSDVNAFISANFAAKNTGNGTAAGLIAVQAPPYPSTAPVLTASTRLNPVQMHMMLTWALVKYAALARADCDALQAEADRYKRISDFYHTFPISLLCSQQTLDDLAKKAADTQKLADDCHQQN